MLKADIANLAWSLSNLREIEKMTADRQSVKHELLVDSELRDLAKKLLGPMRSHFQAYGMPVTLDRLARAEMMLLVDPLLYSKLGSECDEVHQCAQSELRRIYFGYIAANKQDELLKADQAWAATLSAFPRAAEGCRYGIPLLRLGM